MGRTVTTEKNGANMNNGMIGLTLTTILALSTPGWAQKDMRPELLPPVCTVSPVIDGDLQDACWEKATRLNAFYIFKGKGETSSNVVARVTRDNAWLYVAFEIVRPHPETIQPSVLDHDGGASRDDSVEFFLDPGTDGKTYYHYLLNAANARAERECRHSKDIDITWDMPWRSATRITATGWQAEIGVPLFLLKDHDPDKATFNLCVNRVLVTLNSANVVVANRRESLSWAPVNRGFHEPANWGRLPGVDIARITEPLLLGLQSLKAGSYASDEAGTFYYELSGSIRKYTGNAGVINLVAEDKPVTGQGKSVSLEVVVAKARDTSFILQIPVASFSGRTAEVSLRDPKTGEILEKIILRNMADLSLMRSYARYSYYTSEKNADVACEIGLPDIEMQKVSLRATDQAGKTLAEVKTVTARTFIPVPTAKLQLGENIVTVELRRKDDTSLTRQDVSILKRAPRPGCEWKIDRAEKVILNNGKPFFVFGIMAQRVTTNDHEIIAKDLAEIGFNTVVRWSRTPWEDIEDLPKLGQKYGFHVVDFPAMCYQWPAGLTYSKPDLTADEQYDWAMDNVWLPGAKRVMTHPNVMAWYLADEPQDRRELAARILRLYNKINETDGYHPTEVLYSGPVPEGEEFSRNSDIQGMDPYWVPGAGAGEIGSPNTVGRQTWIGRARADRDLKLSWITPCAERWSGTNLRIFTEKEQRVQTYLALIHGAKALLYFVYPFVHESTHDTFARLATEMKTVGPACVTPEVDVHIAYAPVAFDPHSNLFPDVQVGLKRNPAGGYILLAANYRPYPVDATLTLSLLEKNGRVRKLFDPDSAFTVEQGAFSDTFAPMDTRAYAIDEVPEASMPVAISVELMAHPENTDRFLAAAAPESGGASGKKNWLRNPGFEQCSIPGIPDYYLDFRTAKTALGYRLNDTRGDPLVGIETNSPYEGENCLRMSSGFFLFSTGIQEPTPATFVLSAYVRGTTNGGSIGFYGAVDNKKRFPLTPEWQRISTTIQYPFTREGDIFGFSITADKVWIDAMQLEKGTEATDY